MKTPKIIYLGLLVYAACGSSAGTVQHSPPPPPNIQGTWKGFARDTDDPAPFPIVYVLRQDGERVAGQITILLDPTHLRIFTVVGAVTEKGEVTLETSSGAVVHGEVVRDGGEIRGTYVDGTKVGAFKVWREE